MKITFKPLLLFFSVLLYLSFPYKTSATNLIDSLLTSTIKQKPDTNKVNLYVQLSKLYIYREPGKTRKYADSIYNLSVKLDFTPGIADYNYIYSAIKKSEKKLDSANIYINRAIDHLNSFNDYQRKADYCRFYAMILKEQGYVNSAMSYYYKSLDLYKRINNIQGIAKSFNSIGLYYFNLPRYDSAISYFLKSKKLYEDNHKVDGIEAVYLNIGKAFLKLNEFDKANSYFIRSLEISKQNNNLSYIALSYTNLGACAREEKQYEQALSYFDQSYDIYIKLNDISGIAWTFNSRGGIYFVQEMYDSAAVNYQKAHDLHISINDTKSALITYKNLAVIQERYGNYNIALEMYDTILRAERKYALIEFIPKTYFNIFKTYELKKDYKRAFKYQTLHHQLKDSIFDVEKARTIADLELSYQKEKDQAKILELNNENLQKDLDLKTKNNLISLVLAALVLAIIIFIFYRSRVRKNKIIAAQKIKQLEEEKKLLAAKSLVEGQEEERKRIAKELHDGLGVLLSATKLHFTNINDPSPENKEIIQKAEKLLEQASGDVRKISHNMMPGLLTKYGLLETLKDLFESLNDSPGIHARFQLLGDYTRQPENHEIMIYRIVQEMVNNTLKHAEAKNVSLILNFLNDHINIQYSDDGKGFDPLAKLGSKSIGLNSIQSRVNFLTGEIHIESKEGFGTTYNIQLPNSK